MVLAEAERRRHVPEPTRHQMMSTRGPRLSDALPVMRLPMDLQSRLAAALENAQLRLVSLRIRVVILGAERWADDRAETGMAFCCAAVTGQH